MDMRFHLKILAFLGCIMAVPAGTSPADTFTLPMPSVKEGDECKKYSAAEFEQLLQQLKSERSALRAEWNAVTKRGLPQAPSADADTQLQNQLKQALERLKKGPSETVQLPAAPKQLELDKQKIEPVQPSEKTDKKAEELAQPAKEKSQPPPENPVDPLAQAHALFRTHRYEEALASFRQVDLKGRKAEARAPIQYLMAICLLHVGKSQEAVSLLREVANSRGDEKLAGYSQWELELLRWQRDVSERLDAQRQRRKAVEKQL
jgi:tetratricopeptide (TPR) repeat protein